MKKLLPLITIVALFFFASAKNASAYVQTGCIVGNYVCTGTVGDSTCIINQSGYGGTWQPGPPSESVAQLSTNCETQQQFISAGNPWFIQTAPKAVQEYNYAVDHPNEVNYFPFNYNMLTTTAAQGAFLALGIPSTQAGTLQVDSGASGFFASGIDFMDSHRPASSIDYIAYLGSKLQVPGAPTPAYAAQPGGYGFNALGPILPFWTVMRNLAYFAFALVFIIVGLMIMFRVKIDPKTAANIQNSLPKIIFALLLVTFSYAIAGFLIDLMWLLVSLIFGILSSITSIPAVPGIVQQQQSAIAANQSIFEVFLTPADRMASIGALAAGKIAQNIVGLSSGFNWWDLINGKVAAIGGVAILAYLILAIAILWVLFKTWLTLLSAYAQIILAIIFSPLLLMLEAIPGRSTFVMWIKMLITNLLVFPLVIVMLLLSFIMSASGFISTNYPGFVPPLVGGGASTGTVEVFIGIGIMLTIPKALEILQEVLKSPPFKYGTAFMEPLVWTTQKSPVSGAARGAVSTVRGATGGELARRFYTSDALGGATLARQKAWDAIDQEFMAGKIDADQRRARRAAIVPNVPNPTRPGASRGAKIMAGAIDRFRGGRT